MIEKDNCDLCGVLGPVSVKELKTFFGEPLSVRICGACALEVVNEHKVPTGAFLFYR